MNKKTLVEAFIFLTFVIWIAFDVWLAAVGGPTESMVLAEWSKKSVFFCHLMGFLCGHWFVPVKRPWKYGWMWALPIWAVLGAWDFAWNRGVFAWPWTELARFPGAWLVVGIVSGTLLWPQSDSRSPL